jgi:hypothetical protein
MSKNSGIWLELHVCPKRILKTTIHNITIAFKPKENFYMLSHQTPGKERVSRENTSTPFPEGQKEEIGPRKAYEGTMS